MLTKIKNGFRAYISEIRRDGPARLIPALMILFSFVVAFFIFRDIFSFELKHAYTADAPLYWTVGRGILNGLTPYSQMYENKPIGIFLISALSFGLTGDTILCNVFSCIAAVMLTVVPALAVMSLINQNKKDEVDGVRKLAVALTVMLSALIVTVYSEVRSGGFQVEAIGAAFSVLFIFLVIKLKGAKARKKRIVLTILAALALGCAVMIKEPFLLTAVFGALLFVDNFEDLVKNLILPSAVAGVIVILLLAVTGTLVPYFSIYIKRMFETRIGGESTALGRARDLLRVSGDIRNFSDLLFYLLLLFLALALLRAIVKKHSNAHIVFHVLKIAAAVFVASFCVGLGAYYYNHHFIFAVPVYCAFIIQGGAALYEFKPGKAAARGAVLLLWGVVLLLAFVNIGNKYAGDYTEKFNSLSKNAEYVDSLLDYYGEERYQFIGFNGENTFIGLTEHSPQGPVFGQDSDNFKTADTWFSQSLIEQVNNSNIVIVKEYLSPAVNEEIKSILAADFTESPAVRYGPAPPANFPFTIYYRTSKFG